MNVFTYLASLRTYKQTLRLFSAAISAGNKAGWGIFLVRWAREFLEAGVSYVLKPCYLGIINNN